MNKKFIEKAFEKAIWKITKFASEDDFKAGKIMEEAQIDGNILVDEGINEILTIIGSASSGVKYSNANANLIVGTGSGGEAPGNTEATFTAGVKKVMDDGFPTFGTSQKITFQSTYAAGDANQAWNEFGVLNAASGGKLLNRKVSAQGTKTSGQVWQLTLEITLS